MCAYRPFPAACDGQRECRVVQSGGAERLRGRVVTPGATAYAVIELDHSSCEVPQARARRMTSEPFRCAYCPRVAPGSKAHDWNVEVQLLYFDGCPHWTVAEERLRLALASTGNGGQAIEHVLVETPEDAERLGFIGSPTVVVDGRDPFAKGGEQSALACRVYSTPQGPAGSPTIEQLVELLS